MIFLPLHFRAWWCVTIFPYRTSTWRCSRFSVELSHCVLIRPPRRFCSRGVLLSSFLTTGINPDNETNGSPMLPPVPPNSRREALLSLRDRCARWLHDAMKRAPPIYQLPLTTAPLLSLFLLFWRDFSFFSPLFFFPYIRWRGRASFLGQRPPHSHTTCFFSRVRLSRHFLELGPRLFVRAIDFLFV